MPMPVSATANSTQLRPSTTLRTRSATSPCVVNLQALLKRLSRICRSRMGSTVSAPNFSSASTTRRFLFCCASWRAVPMTSSISGAKFTDSGLSSSLPASIFERSSTWLMRPSRCWPAGCTRLSGSVAFSVPKRAALVTIISVKPMMALSGVRSSWLMLATNCDLCWLANSSWRPFSSISWNRRAFLVASTDLAANGRQRSVVVLGNFAGAVPRNQEAAHGLVEAHQGEEQPGRIPRLQHQLVGRNGRLGSHVRDLYRFPLLRRTGHGAGDVYVMVLERGDQVIAHAVIGLQLEFLLRLVVHVDRSGVGIGKLNRLGNDGGEHRLQLERGIDRLRDLAQRPQLFDRLPELLGARAQFGEQTHILDGDDGLAGETLHQLDLLFGERANFLAIHGYRAK